MTDLKQTVKRYMPTGLQGKLRVLRSRIAMPSDDYAKIHGYQASRDESVVPRLTLVIPSIASDAAFGGVLTGLDLFCELGCQSGVDLRIILDDFASDRDRSVVNDRANRAGILPQAIEIVPRVEQLPRISVRRRDIFMTFNWWTALNTRHLIREQAEIFGAAPIPSLYLIQDYEPQFYQFSTSHMLARSALSNTMPYWGVFNTSQLYDYCLAQGHTPSRAFVFEPKISESLRPFLTMNAGARQKRILVYGRPNVPRNCFSALCRGLEAWIDTDAEHRSWEIVSAGTAHAPLSLSQGRSIKSLGKLSLEDYGRLLQSTAVGMSLMASPHPSYPPLEMAHFGVRTITNSYKNKDLSKAHDNIVSIDDVLPETIAQALSETTAAFVRDPEAGPRVQSHVPSFLREGSFECVAAMKDLLFQQVWGPVGS